MQMQEWMKNLYKCMINNKYRIEYDSERNAVFIHNYSSPTYVFMKLPDTINVVFIK